MSKLVIVGAGSAVFTQGLIMDLISARGSEEWELGLVDTNEPTLRAISRLAEKMIRARGGGITVSASTERSEVLAGADFVVSTVGVGGRRSWEIDVFVPRTYGVYQPVGDTVMPGGISRALRMIPALVDIATDVERLCPDAHFFNYANPMAANCTALRRVTRVPVVGLCHGVHDSLRSLARTLGVDPEDLSACAVGINHLTYVYELRARGVDAMPELRRRLATERQEGANPFSWSVFEVTGAYPVPGDRHVTEFYADVFPEGRYYGRTLGVDAFPFEKVIADGDRTHERMVELASSSEPLDDAFFSRFGGEHEQLLDIITSIRRDDRRVYSVNTPNGGSYSNLPAAAVLELPAMATASGFVPIPFDNFPGHLVPVIERHLEIIDLTVEAALTGDRRLVNEAILAGGYLRDRTRVSALVDELIRAQAEFLPRFA